MNCSDVSIYIYISRCFYIAVLVGEDQVGPLGVAALVRAKHDVVRRRVTESSGVSHLRADLHIATSTLHLR